MSCVPIDPRDFHSPEASAYTERCLEALAESKAFTTYVRHLEYKERLHLTWFLIPLGLISVFYYHLSVFDPELLAPANGVSFARLEQRATQTPALPYVVLFSALFLLPCTVTAPFAGFFEEPTAVESARVFFVFAVVNCALVSYGGEWLHHPPFLHTSPTLPWSDILTHNGGSADLTVWRALRILVVRAMPLQGYLIAGVVVSRWQRAFWRRSLHLPFPLLTVPVLSGLWGVFYWRVMSLALPYAFSDEGQITSIGRYSWNALQTDPRGVVSLWGTIAQKIGVAVMTDAAEWSAAGGGLPAAMHDPATSVHAYLAVLTLTVAYFAVLAVRPVVELVVDVACLVLPTNPAIWGLSLLSSAAGAVHALRSEEVPLACVVGPAAMVLLLLYNGFDA